MKFLYITDLNYEGKIGETQYNYNPVYLWQIILNAYHIPLHRIYEDGFEETMNEYDVVLFNYPKDEVFIFDRVLYLKSKTKAQVGLIQHGGCDYFMSWLASIQSSFIRCLRELDFFMYTNKRDYGFYRSLTDKPLIHFKTPIPYDLLQGLKKPINERSGIIIGGNMTTWYAGTWSLILADKFNLPIDMTTMGRRQPDEQLFAGKIAKNYRNHIPHYLWGDFVRILSNYKYAIHMMPVAACGSFHLTCAALGIPCIGRKHIETQNATMPELAIDENFNNINEVLEFMKNMNYEEYSKLISERTKQFDYKVVRKEVLEQFDKLFKNGT